MAETFEALMREAGEMIEPVRRGFVQDPDTRGTTLLLAKHQLRLARIALASDGPERTKRERALRAAERTADKMLGYDPEPQADFFSRLCDWTKPLPRDPDAAARQDGMPFDLSRTVHDAAKRAAMPGAVFAPAHAALAAGLPRTEGAQALLDELDLGIRRAAIAGDPFRVVALGVVAAVVANGTLADALLSALTTSAFHRMTDRGSVRIAYAALANLARPGAVKPQNASEACAYLIRREHAGPDEMELLAPAALQCAGPDGAARLVLLAQWLLWVRDRGPDDDGLPHLAHVARNLGCSLDVMRYGPLEEGLAAVDDERCGEVLVRHLSDLRNDALLLQPLYHEDHRFRRRAQSRDDDGEEGPPSGADRQFGVSPRSRVAGITRPDLGLGADGAVPPIYWALRPLSRAAMAIGELFFTSPYLPPDELSFTPKPRRPRHACN